MLLRIPAMETGCWKHSTEVTRSATGRKEGISTVRCLRDGRRHRKSIRVPLRPVSYQLFQACSGIISACSARVRGPRARHQYAKRHPHEHRRSPPNHDGHPGPRDHQLLRQMPTLRISRHRVDPRHHLRRRHRIDAGTGDMRVALRLDRPRVPDHHERTAPGDQEATRYRVTSPQPRALPAGHLGVTGRRITPADDGQCRRVGESRRFSPYDTRGAYRGRRVRQW